jgi:NADPH-dependent ferric siderophore reductase
MCAKGRVFVEVDSAADIGFIEVPTRMTVTWLTRSNRSGAPGTGEGCSRGVALTRAVGAWSDEMLCDPTTDAHIWLGGDYRAVSGCFEHLTTNVAVDPDRIAAPEQYRLRATR